MIGVVPHSRRARPRMFSRIDGAIHLNVPPENYFRKTNLLLALVFIFIVVLVFHFASKALHFTAIEQDQVQIIQVVPPVSVVQQVKLAPKPSLPKPDPDQPASTAPPKGAPPPPVFGLPEAATSPTGDMAVATGNTLMKQADSVVQKAPPALSAAPIQLDKQPAVLNQVIPEYPAWAEEQGVTATVQLQVTINVQGQVQSVSIVRSGGNDFTRNAIKAVKATRFQPCIKDGVALPAQFLFTYSFIL
jgi:TonB family protein